MLPFDNRRMRLDRICVRSGNNLFKVEDVVVKGKEKIGFGLSASDHFMLIGKFKLENEKKEKVKN